MMAAMLTSRHPRPFVLLLLLAAPACGGSNRHDIPASQSYFTENPSHPIVGDVPPADMDTILEAHNQKRKKHCAPPLEWSAELAEGAQAWADKLAKRGCAFDHSTTKYGENLAAGTESAMGPERAVEIWYEEREHHKFGSKNATTRSGHFTQLVWRDSRKLGCGSSTCNGQRIWVCNYDPPGNVQGEFADEMKPTPCK